jgi:hypothetical protein
VGAHGNTTAPSPALKRDASNSTCYRCGKVGHFTSDPKCPQYKKPEQRCIFAAQVIDDMLDVVLWGMRFKSKETTYILKSSGNKTSSICGLLQNYHKGCKVVCPSLVGEAGLIYMPYCI